MIVLALFIAVLLVYFWPLFPVTKTRRFAKSIPGPLVLPVVGSAYRLIGDGAAFLRQLCELWDEYGARFKIYIGFNNLFLVLSDAKDMEAILTNNTLLEKSSDYELLYPWLGTGLLTSTGEKWRKRRKVITPTFHFKILEHFVETFNTQSEIFVSKLKPYVDKGSFDIFPHVALCALDAVSEAAMGVSIGVQTDTNSEYLKAVRNVSSILLSRMKNPITRLDCLFYLTPEYSVNKNSLKILHDFTDKMIRERRKILELKKESLSSYLEDETASVYGAKKKFAFLDMLLLSTIDSKPLSDLDIREEVDTFLFEGHDTTTSAISFALYLIAHNPDVQKKIYEEQKEIFGNDMNRSATFADVQNMKYLEMACKESMRIYPPVPLFGRKVTEEIQINDMSVPKGTTLALLVFKVNRDPAVFPNPEEFIPERFLAEEIAKRSPFSTISFSAGVRNCIGQKFALVEMKSIISTVLRHYELLPSNHRVILDADLILRSANGVKIRIANRVYR